MSPFNPGTANLAPIMSTGLQQQAQADPMGHAITLQDLIAQTRQRQAATALTTAETQQRQRDLQNAALIRQNLPGLLDTSKGQYDDSVRQGLMKVGVDPEAVEKVIGAKFSNDEAVARTQELQATAQNAQQEAAKAQADLQNQARLHGSALAYKIQQSNYDPSVASAAITDLEKSDSNWAKTGAGAQMLQLMSQDPQGFKAKIDAMVGNPDFQAQQAGIQSTQAETKRAGAQTAQIEQQTELTRQNLQAMQQYLNNPQATLGPGGVIDKVIDPKKYPDINQRVKGRVQAAYAMPGTNPEKVSAANEAIQQGAAAADAMDRATNPDLLNFDIKKAGATAKATAEAQASVFNANPNSIDLMAEQALNGQFTSRNPVLMAQVYGRAAQLAQQRGLSAQQVIMERNSATANKEALNAVTKQYQELKPFADMAEKNAGILEQKAAKVANLGAPALNTPIRNLQAKFAGNADVAAYRAALLPVQSDFARILSSPTGAGQLTDEARRDMENAIAPGATPQQVTAALNVFRTDAKNRREAYESTISQLKGQTTVNGNSAPVPAAAPATGKIRVKRLSDGATGTIDAGDFDSKKYSKL